jgi:hypothetical protein
MDDKIPKIANFFVKNNREEFDNSSPASISLRRFLKTINSIGEDAQESYNDALKDLRQDSESIIFEIAREEKACNPTDYVTRWGLIHAATELRHPLSISFLKNIILTPIPPELSKDPHSFSTAANETIIRTTAIEGIKYLAQEGDEDALNVLFECLNQPSISVRRASIQAILSVRKDESSLQRIKDILPGSQQFLLNLRQASLKDVAQISNPQKHLRNPDSQEELRKKPLLTNPGETGKNDTRQGPKV